MSTSEGAATSQRSIENPHGSKRGACDRCRGQKLRCLREDQSQNSPQATCIRCFKAGATCSYGVIKRAGRCPGSKAPSPQERRENGGGKPKKGGMASRPTVSTSGHGAFFHNKAGGGQDWPGTGGQGSGRLLGEYSTDQESEGETEDITATHALSPFSLHDTSNILGGVDFPILSPSSTAALPWPNEVLPPFSINDAEASGLEPFAFNYGWAFNQRPTCSPNNDEQPRDVGANAYGTHAQTCSTEKEAGIKFDGKAHSVYQIQHRRMQELSELAMDLYAQLADNDPEIHQPTSDATATTFQDQFIGSVLKSSNTFLTLLISFSAPSMNSTSHSSASPSSALDYDNPAIVELMQHPSSKRPAGIPDDSKQPTPIDMTTVLQLLTCHIRILHLHSIMHARILDYMLASLQHTAQHVDSVPPIFPGMQVGGVSLNKFGTFQVKVLMQISMHVLGEIESALGLPDEDRVGKRKGRGPGILGASVSQGFVECLMKEGAWRGNKVECMREQLGNLRKVLKEAVDF